MEQSAFKGGISGVIIGSDNSVVGQGTSAVSYTHLTLPTIYSV